MNFPSTASVGVLESCRSALSCVHIKTKFMMSWKVYILNETPKSLRFSSWMLVLISEFFEKPRYMRSWWIPSYRHQRFMGTGFSRQPAWQSFAMKAGVGQGLIMGRTSSTVTKALYWAIMKAVILKHLWMHFQKCLQSHISFCETNLKKWVHSDICLKRITTWIHTLQCTDSPLQLCYVGQWVGAICKINLKRSYFYRTSAS